MFVVRSLPWQPSIDPFHNKSFLEFILSCISFIPYSNRHNSYMPSLSLTPHTTGSEKHSEERAALFVVRVHAFVSAFYTKERNDPPTTTYQPITIGNSLESL
jgi:hypothetical protein